LLVAQLRSARGWLAGMAASTLVPAGAGIDELLRMLSVVLPLPVARVLGVLAMPQLVFGEVMSPFVVGLFVGLPLCVAPMLPFVLGMLGDIELGVVGRACIGSVVVLSVALVCASAKPAAPITARAAAVETRSCNVFMSGIPFDLKDVMPDHPDKSSVGAGLRHRREGCAE